MISYGGRIGPGWDEDAGDTANTQVVVHEFGDKTLVFEVRNMASPDLSWARASASCSTAATATSC